MSISPRIIIAIVTGGPMAAGIGYVIYKGNAKSKAAAKKIHKGANEPTSGHNTANVMTEIISDSMSDAAGQADAVVVDVVNAIRIDQLLKKIARIDHNQIGAEEEIKQLKKTVEKLLSSNRGGEKGIHGFLGETSQVHISNIKSFLNDEEPLYILLDDNSMTDYTRGMQLIQQKACRSGGYLGLDHIKAHSEKYPEFIKEGGIYQIPKDMFSKYKQLKDMSQEAAMKLCKEDLRLWKYIRQYTDDNPDIRIESMEVSYTDIRAGNIQSTVDRVEKNTDQEFEKQRKDAIDAHAPTWQEFLKVCGISAAVEGGISAGIEFIEKLKERKKLSNFTKQDITDILTKLMLGSGKGALRGGLVYLATNFLKMSASVACGIVTALFGVVQEGYMCLKHKITKKEFGKKSFFVILETAASAGGATFGKHVCKKCPVIGAIVGSLIGSLSVGGIRKVAFA